VIAKIAACGDVDVDRAVTAARAAFDAGEWSRIDIPDAVNTLRWYAEAADKVFGKTSPTGADSLGLIANPSGSSAACCRGTSRG
jgi:4-(gamma-glutamylamino)butanal dehydrogenase